MAICRLTTIFVLVCLLLIQINCDNDVQLKLKNFYRPQIWSVLNYLNSFSDRVYDYDYATLINAQNKNFYATELTLDIDVTCRDVNSNQCLTNLLECKTIVRYNFDFGNYDVRDVFCVPKTYESVSNQNPETEITKTRGPLLQSDGRQPAAESPITKNNSPCVGCPFELNPNLESLKSLAKTALQHIESERDSKHIVVRIIRARRQIVAGVKYILLLEIAPTDCSKDVDDSSLNSCNILSENSQVCEVEYYQRPWISKKKTIISNNCTTVQAFDANEPLSSRNDQDNEIDENYVSGKNTGVRDRTDTGDLINYDSIAENGNVDDILKLTGGIMDSDRIKDLESQIVFKQSSQPVTTEASTTEYQSSVSDVYQDETRMKRAAKNNDNDNNNNNDEDESSSNSSSSSEEDNEEAQYEKTKRKYKKYNKNENNNDDDSSSSSSSSSEENKGKKQKPKKVKRETNSSESEESKEKKAKSTTAKTTTTTTPNEISSEEESSEEHRGGVRKKRSLRLSDQFVKISPEEKNFVANLADFSAYTLDDIDSDHHKRVVLQILGAKKNLKGDLYHLTLRVGISRCPEQNNSIIDLHKMNQNDKECRSKLMENLTKICRIQIRLDDNKNNPKVEKSQCQNIKKNLEDTNSNRTNRSKRGGEKLVGGTDNVDPQDPKIVEYSQKLIEQWDAFEGTKNKRQLVRVLSATKQVVAGMLYKLELEFTENGSNLICRFNVWEQAWKNPSKKVDIDCNNGKGKKTLRFRRSYNQNLLGGDDHDINIGLFKNYMKQFNKTYNSKQEFKNRFKIFRKNMEVIKVLNENEQGTAKYGPTIFADLTPNEFKSFLGLKLSLRDENSIPLPKAKIPNIELPKQFDWREKGIVSEVKNQGQCGSCWAFSVTGNIEGLNAIKTGNLVELSEQELVDCDTLDDGCDGGLPDNAYRSIEKLGGLESESDYPYEAENEKCHFNKSLTRVQISGAVNISSNETDMAKWLVKNGPISIGINANAMQFYVGGISHPWKFTCDPHSLDHGVLIVGYGVHKNTFFNKIYPYWIIKNSWGPSWGEQGYYRVFRGDGTCGVNQMASSAIL